MSAGIADGKGCRYIVFWYPTIFHENLTPPINKEIGIDNRVKEKNKYCTDYNDISDKSPNDKLFLKKELSKDGDLTYLLTKDINEDGIKIELRFKNSNNTGFAIYSYDSEIEQRIINFLGIDSTDRLKVETAIESIFNLCYHFAKDIYHKHEAHKDSDYRLKPYYKNSSNQYIDGEEPCIFKQNNEVISHFIKLYEDLFVSYYARTISESYETFSNNYSKFLELIEKGEKGDECIIEHWGELQEYSDKIEKGLKKFKEKEKGSVEGSYEEARDYARNLIKEEESAFRRETVEKSTPEPYNKNNFHNLVARVKKNISQYCHELNDLCNNALTEYNYCKSLLESVYNTEFIHDVSCQDTSAIPQDSNDTEKNRRKEVAFNIRNSLRYIEGVRKKCSMWDSLITHNLTQDVEKLIQENNNLTNSTRCLINESSQLTANVGVQIAEIKKLTKDVKEQIGKGKCSNIISLCLGALSVILAIFFGVPSCKSNHVMKCNCQTHQTTNGELYDSTISGNDTEAKDYAVEFDRRKSDIPQEDSSSKRPSNSNRK